MTSSNETKIDLQQICRLCLSEDKELTNVMENEEIVEYIHNKIYSCLLVEILVTDEISQKICQSCLNKVEEFYSFKQLVNENQETLEKLLFESKNMLFKFEGVENTNSSDSDLETDNIDSNTRDEDVEIIEQNILLNNFMKQPTQDTSQAKVPVDRSDNPLDLRCSSIFRNKDLNSEEIFNKQLKKVSHNCEKCGKSFSSLRTLLKHLSRIHIKNQTYSCLKCNLNFKNSKQLKVHNWGHKEKYACDKCSYFSYSSSNFKLHLMKHNSEYLAICEDCGKGFYRMSLYQEHKLKNHSQEIVVYKCDKCEKAYHSHSYLQQHAKVHEPDYQRKDYQCELCGKTFLSWNSIKRHIVSFHQGARFKCDFCSKEVTSRQSLKNHKKTHTGEKSYMCDECGKAFLRLSSLVVHRRIHSGEKPYSCDVCKKSFSQRSTLNVHSRSHTGERPYPCQKCNKRFITKTLLNVHLKSHNLIN